MQLTVKKIDGDDIFQDIVRIPRKFRGGIPEGELCRITTSVKSKIFLVYGNSDDDEPHIYMDLRSRRHFGLSPGSPADFSIRPVGWFGLMSWAWKHANPTMRVAAQLGVISLGLGVVSLILGVVAVVK